MVSKSLVQTVTKLLKLKPFETAAVHELQPHDPANRIYFCNWILKSGRDGEIDSHLTVSSDKA
jgi:hypothetical protein